MMSSEPSDVDRHPHNGGPLESPSAAPLDRRALESGPASFSKDRMYRYTLWRTWDKLRPKLMVIGLNPSTADETALDPTLRRCIGFASTWGFGGLVMTNLFAYRATDPKAMRKAEDPVGPANDDYLKALAVASRLVLAAWGTHGCHRGRDRTVMRLLTIAGVKLHTLGLTNNGSPRHPLYVKADTKPVLFRPAWLAD